MFKILYVLTAFLAVHGLHFFISPRHHMHFCFLPYPLTCPFSILMVLGTSSPGGSAFSSVWLSERRLSAGSDSTTRPQVASSDLHISYRTLSDHWGQEQHPLVTGFLIEASFTWSIRVIHRQESAFACAGDHRNVWSAEAKKLVQINNQLTSGVAVWM